MDYNVTSFNPKTGKNEKYSADGEQHAKELAYSIAAKTLGMKTWARQGTGLLAAYENRDGKVVSLDV